MKSKIQKSALRNESKRIGILGGISHESTAKYYERIHQLHYQIHGDYYYPEVVIFSLNFQKFTDFEDSKDRDGYIQYIMEGIKALEKSSPDVLIMSANSPHAVFEDIQKSTSVPMISIAEVTAQEASRRGLKKLLLMGIKFTMQSSFYQKVCQKYGIEVVVPSDVEQDKINSIIFEELCRGIVTEKSKKDLVNIIHQYPVEGVILGCTELPLILEPQDTHVSLLNTLELHVQALLA